MSSRRREARRAEAARKQAEARAKISRRRVLQIVGAAALLAAAGVGYIAERPQNHSSGSPSLTAVSPIDANDPWYFAKKQVFAKSEEPDTVQKLYVPIGATVVIGGTSYDDDDPLASHIRQASARRFGAPTLMTYSALSLTYAVPTDPKVAEHYLGFVKKAGLLLRQRLSGLDEGLELKAISQGDNYTSGYDRTGFIGEYFVKTYQGRAVSQANPAQIYDFRAANPNEGSYTGQNPDDGSVFIIFGVGNSSLDAAISEPIHATTVKTERDYHKKTGDRDSYKIDEGLAHGASSLIVPQLLDELNFPEGRALHAKFFGLIIQRPRYSLVRNARDWMQRNGVQAGFDLYMENPAKFRDAILA
ncbi:hypothetical protein HYY74_01460 [Candidatus Woesearchaeota archaeon]|nr:hypothetical protein [Candidatus Woesearchaeota archaeon]